MPEAKITRLNEKIATLRQEIRRLNALNAEMMQTEDKQISLTDPDARSMTTGHRFSNSAPLFDEPPIQPAARSGTAEMMLSIGRAVNQQRFRDCQNGRAMLQNDRLGLLRRRATKSPPPSRPHEIDYADVNMREKFPQRGIAVHPASVRRSFRRDLASLRLRKSGPISSQPRVRLEKSEPSTTATPPTSLPIARPTTTCQLSCKLTRQSSSSERPTPSA